MDVEQREAVKILFGCFIQYSDAVSEFRRSLYHQKHAFYFRAVGKWDKFLKVSYFATRGSGLTRMIVEIR